MFCSVVQAVALSRESVAVTTSDSDEICGLVLLGDVLKASVTAAMDSSAAQGKSVGDAEFFLALFIPLS